MKSFPLVTPNNPHHLGIFSFCLLFESMITKLLRGLNAHRVTAAADHDETRREEERERISIPLLLMSAAAE